METIKKYLRMRSKSCKEILDLIREYVKEDKSNNYWDNNLVELTDAEYTKLINTYWTVVIKHFIENLDSYIYKTGKQYKSHYLTIMNWIRKDWKAVKIKPTYVCSYWTSHYVWIKCDCGNF